MAKLVIKGLTLEQAKELAHWFEGQGEQDCSVWFEDTGIKAPFVDMRRKPWLTVEKVVDDDEVTIWCRS